MKKKLLVILLTLVLAVTMIVATACNDSGMIVKNQERNFSQVTASVTYADRAAQVDKLDLNATINNFVYQYYSYYQQGYLSQTQYQSVLDNIATSYKQANESLAETEAYTLKCLDELYKRVQSSGTAEEKAAAAAANTAGKAFNTADRIKEIESVLSLKDRIAAVEAYNEEMQTGFDSYREAYEKEMANAAVTNKSTDNIKELSITAPAKTVYEVGESINLNGLEVSVVYNDGTTLALERSEFTVTGFSSESVTDSQEVTVTFGNTTATFDVQIIAAKPNRPAMPKDEEEEEKTEIPELFEVSLEKQIADAKAAGDDALYKTLKEAKRRFEKQMSTNYRTYEYYYLSKLKTQAVTAYEEIVGKAATTTSAEIQAEYQKNLESQKQALLLGSTTYSSVVEGTGVKTQIVHENDQYFYVQNLLFKITDDLQAKYDAFEKEKVANKDALEAYLNSLIDQTGVYVSNVEYDKDAECEDEECTCVACQNYKGETPGECTDENCPCVKCPNKRFITAEFAEENGLTLNANGTINVQDMIGAIYNDLGTVGSTDEARAEMLEKFKKWVYMCNDDEGFFTTLTDGKLGYGLSMTDSSYVENFTALSRALAYGTAAEKAEWHIVGEGVGSYGWCYTNYGIHIVMLSGYALEDAAAVTDLGNGLYALPMNAITDYTAYEAATEDDLAKGTLAYGIKENLLSDAKDELVGAFKKAFYQEEMEKNAKITYYNVYQDLIDQYND